MCLHDKKTSNCLYFNVVPSLFPCRVPPDQLYFAILQQKIKSTAERHCFCIDEELAYEK